MIDRDLLQDKFARIGARLKLADIETFGPIRSTVSLDIRSDRKGEFFEILNRVGTDGGIEIAVLDVQPDDRHLLLLVRRTEGEKQKFLCGHDERHWFVAAIPESAPVGTVASAKEALKPPEVQEAQARLRLGASARGQRKNAAYRRQGEWFFLPAPDVKVDPSLVLRNEPIRRGNGGKPHWVDFCYRTGGEQVHVCRRYPNGVLPHDYQKLIDANPSARSWGWRVMRRNAEVYVRGRVRHADHRTITLHGWHRVLMNTESQARAMQSVAFLD